MTGSGRSGLRALVEIRAGAARRGYPSRRFAWLGALATLVTGFSSEDANAADVTTTVSVLGDMMLVPAVTGHGAVLLALDVDDLARDSTFSVVLDTEKLRLAYESLRLATGVWLNAHAEGEALFAAVLPDYFQEGERVSERGFNAGYAGGGLSLTLSPHRSHWIRAGAGVRRWFFDANADTGESLTLPADVTVVASSLGYSFWQIVDASDFHERQRRFPRVMGGAFGFEVSGWVRSDDSEWGAIDSAFTPADTRNDPDPTSLRLRLWLLGGTWLGDGVRWQFDHRAAYGLGEDDLSRDRLGGLNPYVVPVAGSPWGAYVSERYLSGQWSWHVPVSTSHELGVLLGGAYLDDLSRTGDSSSGPVFGAAGFADLRFGDWQTDLRIGWTPTLETGEDSPQGVSLSFSVGWAG